VWWRTAWENCLRLIAFNLVHLDLPAAYHQRSWRHSMYHKRSQNNYVEMVKQTQFCAFLTWNEPFTCAPRRRSCRKIQASLGARLARVSSTSPPLPFFPGTTPPTSLFYVAFRQRIQAAIRLHPLFSCAISVPACSFGVSPSGGLLRKDKKDGRDGKDEVDQRDEVGRTPTDVRGRFHVDLKTRCPQAAWSVRLL